MKKTEDILERLKGQMPQVPDSDMLTESIMSAVTAKRSRIVPLWVNVMRIVSSAAAVLLIALFIGVNSTDQISAAEGVRYIHGVAQKNNVPMVNDVKTAVMMMNNQVAKRKTRQLRETKIKNLYAKF